ncbi:MAG: RluA family pseudouridine synthase [Lentisphaeria bacterium]
MQRKNNTTISELEEGIRLDLFLSERFNYHNRQRWQEEIDNGYLTVNGDVTKPSYKLKTNDLINYMPPARPEPEVSLYYKIIFEDEHFLIINKPGNLPVHPSGRFFNHTLWALLKQKYSSFHFVNRLDRETSGIVVVALTKVANKSLSKQMLNHELDKRYQLIVHGNMTENIAAIGYLGKDEESAVRKKRAFFLKNVIASPNEQWETSSTWFTPINSNDKFTLVDVKIGTGRLHQIRATAFSMGFPVVGDKIYGIDDNLYLRYIDNQIGNAERQALILDRQALHASSITIKHPISDEILTFHCDICPQIIQKLNL